MERDIEMLNKEAEKKFQKFEDELNTGYKVKAIGYLDSSEEYKKGYVPNKFLIKLRALYQDGIILGSMGYHECDFCSGGYGTGERAKSDSEKILVDEKNKIKYVFPFMIFHYCESHHYLPPLSFIEFVMRKI